MDFIQMILPLILTNNLVMSLVKSLSVSSQNIVWLRGLLLLFSGVGVVAASAVSGNPVDFNQLSDIAKAFLEILALAVGSHFSYKVIKTA